MRNIFNYTLIASTIRLSTPLILAALGGLYSERAGVINIALEGMMLAGAFTAAVVTVFTHNPWIGLLSAVSAGLLVAALHAMATIKYRADQVVSGTAINILSWACPRCCPGRSLNQPGRRRNCRAIRRCLTRRSSTRRLRPRSLRSSIRSRWFTSLSFSLR